MGARSSADDAVRFTSELIRIDTTNRGAGDCRERPAAEYVAERLGEAGLDALLLESAPGRANVVTRIPGSAPGLPALLVHGHLDVVPAEASDWSVHPFSGEVTGGAIWGRGALDMKGIDAMVLAVVCAWEREGRRPARDVVLAFTADEEDAGVYGAGWLARRHPELFEGCTEAIGEGGGHSVHAPNGVRLYPVAAAERGTAWLRLVARGHSGHGSRVNHQNAVVRLATAVAQIGAHRWPIRLTPTVRAALQGIEAALGAPCNVSNPGAEPALPAPAGILVASTLANSANPTMLQAGTKLNVVPAEAVAHVDGRILPGCEEEFRTTLDRLTGPDVTWEPVHWESPLESSCDAAVFVAMRNALLAEDPGAHVIPYCTSGGTDAKHFARLGMATYGFAPLGLPPGYDFESMIHTADERVTVEALSFGTRVLDRFLTAAH